jgi:hypothetical protein
MSGDIPLYFVFASCPPEQVAPLHKALDDLEYPAWCPNHEDGACFPLGQHSTEYEAYPHEVGEMFDAILAAAPGAGFAVIGSASEEGQGMLLMHHPSLGPYRQDVAPDRDMDDLSPLFTRCQVEEIVASASSPDELDVALGGPWVQQFAPLPAGCQPRYSAADRAAEAERLRWAVATGALTVHREMCDSVGQSWATATWRGGGSVVLTGDGDEYRVTDRGDDHAGAEVALTQRLRWLRRS